MAQDRVLVNPVNRIALGIAGGLVAALGLIAPHGASAAAPAPPECPPKLACEHHEPTKLWYRVQMSFNGKDTRELSPGGTRFVSRVKWELASQHAVLLERVCYHPRTRRHQAMIKDGPCPHGPGTGRLIDDVSFAAGAEGKMLKNVSTETFDFPDFSAHYNGKDGRVTCGEAQLEVKMKGVRDITGYIDAAAASKGFGWAIDMPMAPDDATERDPLNDVECTFEEYDPIAQTYGNPQPYTVNAGTPGPSYMTDLAVGRDTAYSRGMEWSDLLDFRFPPSKFGFAFSKDFHVESEADDRPPLPPLSYKDELTLKLDPCPRHGRDIDSC